MTQLINYNKSLSFKVAILLLIIIYLYGLILSNNTIDDFLPNHFSRIIEIINNGHIVNTEWEYLLNYYVYGAIICIFQNIPASSLAWTPIGLFGTLTISYLLGYLFTKNHLISVICAGIFVSTSVFELSTLMFHPHSLGRIITLVYLILLIMYIQRDKLHLPLFILLMILPYSLYYLSYDYYAILGLIMGSFIALIIIGWIGYQTQSSFLPSLSNMGINLHKYLKLILIMIIFVLYGNFMYNTFAEYVFTVGLTSDISPIIKIINYFPSIFGMSTNNQYLDIMFSGNISFIALSKYILYILVIIIYLFWFFNKRGNKGTIEDIDYIVLSIVMGMLFYFSIRIGLGAIHSVGLIYIPAVFCMLRLFTILLTQKNISKILFTSICIILILMMSSVLIYSIYGGITSFPESQFLNNNEEYIQTSLWTNEFIDYEETLMSDIFTVHTIIMNIMRINSDCNYFSFMSWQIFRLPDIWHFLTTSGESQIANYVILNYALPRLSVGENWELIKPLSQYITRINYDATYNYIYTTDNMVILKSTF